MQIYNLIEFNIETIKLRLPKATWDVAVQNRPKRSRSRFSSHFEGSHWEEKLANFLGATKDQ